MKMMTSPTTNRCRISPAQGYRESIIRLEKEGKTLKTIDQLIRCRFKYLLLKSIFDLSDVDVVERSKYDMSFKYFLDMAPEDMVIDPSSLTKLRKLRLKGVGLLDMLIQKTVEIALEKDLIKSKSIIVDDTHTKARFNQKSPKEFLMEKSKLLRKAVYQIDKGMKEKFPHPKNNDRRFS